MKLRKPKLKFKPDYKWIIAGIDTGVGSDSYSFLYQKWEVEIAKVLALPVNHKTTLQGFGHEIQET